MMQRRDVTPLINTLILVSRYSLIGHAELLPHHIAQRDRCVSAFAAIPLRSAEIGDQPFCSVSASRTGKLAPLRDFGSAIDHKFC